MSEDINPELIDKAARAAYCENIVPEYHEHKWSTADTETIVAYYREARAALSAVLPDVIRQAKAKAWDEGRAAGADMGIIIGERIVGTRSDWPAVPKNPYRADRIEPRGTNE